MRDAHIAKRYFKVPRGVVSNAPLCVRCSIVLLLFYLPDDFDGALAFESSAEIGASSVLLGESAGSVTAMNVPWPTMVVGSNAGKVFPGSMVTTRTDVPGR